MIVRALPRRLLAVRPSPVVARTHVRHVHKLPTLANHDGLRANGLAPLFSKEGFDIAFTQYHGHLVEQLNNATIDDPYYHNVTPQVIAVHLARDPQAAPLFNLASMAWNNHFFFNGLNLNANHQSKPSDLFMPLITRSFSSLESLRETFLLTADAMFGPGFVWLVYDTDREPERDSTPLRILTTYLAGSPLSGAHHRRQSVDLNTENVESYAGSFGEASRARDKRPMRPLGGVNLTPVLCVNTWEHAWLHDHGVRGKMDYLEKWWDLINWDTAERYAGVEDLPKSAAEGERKWVYG